MNIPGTLRFKTIKAPHFITMAAIGDFFGLQKHTDFEIDDIQLARTLYQFWKRPVIALNLDHTSDVIRLWDKTALDLLIPNIFARIEIKADGILAFHETGQTLPCVVLNFHADCINLIVYGRNIRGTIHVSRLNLLPPDGIIQKMVALAKEMGENPENLSIGIFPGICQNCFDFKSDSVIIKTFYEFFPKHLYPYIYLGKPDRTGIDLARATEISLHYHGVNKVEILDHCSFCSKNGRDHLFHSYRRSLQNGEKDCRNATGLIL